MTTTIDVAKLVSELKKVKQKVFDDAVNGFSEEPHEVVDTVVYALMDAMPSIKEELYAVANFYPEY